LKDVFISLGRPEDEATKTIAILRDNWYESLDQLPGITDDRCKTLGLPLRLLDVITERIAGSGDSAQKPLSITKEISNLKIDDEKLEMKEEVADPEPQIVIEDEETEDNGDKIKLSECLEGVSDFDEALLLLKINGEKEGVQFKKGKNHYIETELKSRCSVWSRKNLHPSKKSGSQSEALKEELGNSKYRMRKLCLQHEGDAPFHWG